MTYFMKILGNVEHGFTLNVLDIIFADWWHSNIIKTRIDNPNNSFWSNKSFIRIKRYKLNRLINHVLCGDDVVSRGLSKNDNYEWQNIEIIMYIYFCDIRYRREPFVNIFLATHMQNWSSVKWCYADNFIF